MLWTLNFFQGGLGTNCFGHTKFEVKIVLEFFHLQSTVDSEFFAVGVWAPTFFGHAKFEVKTFLDFFNLQSTLDSEFFAAQSGHQLFFVTLNLRSKIFRNFFLYQALWTEFFREGSGPTFFGDAKI